MVLLRVNANVSKRFLTPHEVLVEGKPIRV